MDENERIKQIMRIANIPREAMATTLVQQGLTEVREYITNKGYSTNPLVYIYPSATKAEASYEKARLCMYLMVKEVLLSGESGYACSLSDWQMAWAGDDSTGEAGAIFELCKTKVMAIDRFHDKGGRVSQFLDQKEIQRFYSWLVKRYDGGATTILLGSAALPDCEEWWPSSMLAYIRNRAVTFQIKG